MLRFLMKWRIAAFERRYGYDAGYLRDLADADVRALFAMAKVGALSRYRGGLPVAAWFAAKLMGTLHEDCGPCTQLVVRMAEEAGVDADTLRLVVADDPTRDGELDAGTRAVVRLCRASLARRPADDERAAMLARFGPRGLAAVALALASARVYPTVKYALGHGEACARVVVSGAVVTPHGGPREAAA